MATAFFFVLLSVLGAPVYAAFGITTSDSAYTIDAGSNESLVFTVSRSSCDITSIKYRGTEVQYPGKGTHIGSGLGSATVEATVVSGKQKEASAGFPWTDYICRQVCQSHMLDIHAHALHHRQLGRKHSLYGHSHHRRAGHWRAEIHCKVEQRGLSR
jgi:hypothetical protein